MIPKDFIIEWSDVVPWQEPRQIEQDLIITTALLKLYNHSDLRNSIAFRGGTALNKIFFNPPSRYSEDIDFVQIKSQPIGPTINLIREVMDSWLGEPKRDFSNGLVTLTYKFKSEDDFPLKLKVEINTREHFNVMEFQDYPLSSISSWHADDTVIRTYQIEELLGTKLRALYQRRKGRDLYDLYIALTNISKLDLDAILKCFQKYMSHLNHNISKSLFLENLEIKIQKKDFRGDMLPLLPRQKTFDLDEAYEHVRKHLIEKL